MTNESAMVTHYQPLSREAFASAPDVVGPMLLGQLLVRRLQGCILAGRIVETEAYFGQDDPAAHAFAGRTARNEVLFGPPGFAYVYFIYGMYNCLNVSCEPEGLAGCVLIRALEPLAGLAEMAGNRGLPSTAKPPQLTAGPGRLCSALNISRQEHNGADLTSRLSDLQICQGESLRGETITTARIGITRAAERPLRYTLAGNACVSRGKYWKASG